MTNLDCFQLIETGSYFCFHNRNSHTGLVVSGFPNQVFWLSRDGISYNVYPYTTVWDSSVIYKISSIYEMKIVRKEITCIK